MATPKRIHFLGIGGSGLSAVAQIAAAQGYEVTGCDRESDTPYLAKVKKAGIKVAAGHSADHLADIDILAVTPAVFYQNATHPEIAAAREKGILIKWQDFLGQYLHAGKYVISFAGTHGKSTTTSLAGLLLEAAGLDPTVEVGATVNAWHNNIRIGRSQYFITEADEFHDNFASYQSDAIILTLLEFDHPEYFGTIENMLKSFQTFIDHRKPGAFVIVNSDSVLVSQLNLPPDTHYYSQADLKDVVLDPSGSTFTYQSVSYHLALPGRHNILNSLAVINLARLLNIDLDITKKVLSTFTGIGRRLELIGQKGTNFVYDDYANHPSSFAASVSAVRQLHPDHRIIAVIEPHTYSRLRSLENELGSALSQADEVLVSAIFASRESDPGDYSGKDIVAAINSDRPAKLNQAVYIPDFETIVSELKARSLQNTIVLVMGSGNSHKLSRLIFSSLD